MVTAKIAALQKDPTNSHLLESLADPSFRVQEKALQVLSDQRFAAIFAPQVIRLSRSRHAFIRGMAAEVLGECRSPACFRALLLALKDRDDMVRVNAAESLGRIGDRRAVRPLIQAMNKDKSVLVRATAADALGEFRESVVKDALVVTLRKQSRKAVRVRVLFSLYRLGQTGRLEELLSYLVAPDYRVRSAVANMLSDISIHGRRRSAARAALREALAREDTIAARSSMRRSLAEMA